MNKSILLCCLLINQLFLIGQVDSINYELLASLPAGTTISIGVYEQNEIKKYGFIVENQQLQIKENSAELFEIGSITKVFTTLSALQILNQNQIGINDSIFKYLPNQAQNISKNITFFQLMTHTSGLPKLPDNFILSTLRCPTDPFLHYGEKRMFRYLRGFSPLENETFQYSNIGMGLLGYISAETTSQPLDSLMKNEIFGPLNMKATSLGISKEQFSLVVNSIGLSGKPKRTWEFSDVTKGAGSAYSTVDDMMLFLEFLLKKEDSQNELFSQILEMEKEQITINETESMGLGWRIFKGKSNIIYHGGITYGFKSLIAFNRNARRGMVVLTNAKGLSRKENSILKQVCFQYLENMKTATN